MYKPKYPKTNLRNPKNINPNSKDSDQRGRKRPEGEKDSGRGDPGRPRPRRQAREPQAWVARGLGSCDSGRPRRASPRPGSHAAWVVHGGLKPPTPIFFFSLGSSLMFWWFLSDLFLFIRDINRVLETQFLCNRHLEKYATSDVIRA